MSTPTSARPARGEVWRVNLDPTCGAEMRKTRPVVVMSSDAVGKLPIRLVAPITSWDDRFADHIWHVKISPCKENGLSKPSSVDVLQTRSVDVSRFTERMGRLTSTDLEEILAALAAVVEYE